MRNVSLSKPQIDDLQQGLSVVAGGGSVRLLPPKCPFDEYLTKTFGIDTRTYDFSKISLSWEAKAWGLVDGQYGTTSPNKSLRTAFYELWQENQRLSQLID